MMRGPAGGNLLVYWNRISGGTVDLSIDEMLREGVAHHLANRLGEAERSYRQVLVRDANQPDALHLLGILAGEAGKHELGVDLVERAIRLRPEVAVFWGSLGNLEVNRRQWERAIAAFSRALELQPAWAEGLHNFGNALRGAERLEEAVSVSRRAIQLKPGEAGFWVGLAVGLSDLGRFEESQAAQEEALRLSPGLPEAHWGRALLLLRKGEFERGWKEHEWRWQWAGYKSPRRNFAQGQWDGRELHGERVLVHAEAGFGDTIQFMRLAKEVRRRGGRVILEVPTELKRLLEGIEGAERVVAKGEDLGTFEWHCPMMSLPLALGMKRLEEAEDGRSRYVRLPAGAGEKWKERLGRGAVNVGIVWAGRAEHMEDRRRSMRLEMLAPLAKVEGVRLVSLQKGLAAEQVAEGRVAIEDWMRDVGDFTDTAGLVESLDLVIAVDTAVVHLAGAMGKPVWVMLPFVADWRWMSGREDSPWYSSARLFRQKAAGDWQGVVQEVAGALKEFVAQRA